MDNKEEFLKRFDKLDSLRPEVIRLWGTKLNEEERLELMDVLAYMMMSSFTLGFEEAKELYEL